MQSSGKHVASFHQLKQYFPPKLSLTITNILLAIHQILVERREKTNPSLVMEKAWGSLGHLFTTVFLYCFSSSMVIPAIVDVTMTALCPGKDECSLAIYVSGIHQAIIGIGAVLAMPIVGNLSDSYGRKSMLTIPMALTVFPFAILAYSRSKAFFYAYFALKTLLSMLTDGTVHCLALAYVADNIPEARRASVFGILSGIISCSFVCGNLSGRFLSTSAAFQGAAVGSVIALVYMKVFLQESNSNNARNISSNQMEAECFLEKAPKKALQSFKNLPSLDDIVSLLQTSTTFSRVAAISFVITVAEGGVQASLLYYLKAQFHFNKDQFADLMIISGVAGSVSQLLLLPILVAAVGEEKLLSVGLFFSCVNMLLYSVAWSSWVPFVAAVMSVLSNFAMACLQSIASKQIGPYEQGKAQGCLKGICAFASIVSPLAFSPLTALFLSERAPFHFPGFSIASAAFAGMIAFFLSVTLKTSQPGTSIINNKCHIAVPKV